MKSKNRKNGVPLFGEGISRTDALRFIKRHKQVSNLTRRGTIHVTFTFSEILDMIKIVNREDGLLRVYFARNDKNKRTAVLVAARPIAKGRKETIELTRVKDPNTIIGRDFGTLCPPECYFEEDKESLAYEVYHTKIKNTKKKNDK